MFIRTLTLSLLALGLTACGGEETPADTASYTDASSAVDAGNAALAGGDYAKAAGAFEYAIGEAPNAQYKLDWSMELFKALALDGKDAEAMEAMNGALAESGDALTGAKLQALADFCITKKNAKLTNYVANVAKDALPEAEQSAFDGEKVAKAVAALQSGNDAALAALGYVGE